MERKKYKPGERIFLEGESADCAYLIEEGKVELTKRKDDDVVIVNIASKGEMIGDMALIDSSPRSASARCAEATVALVIPEGEFQRRLDAADPVIRRLLQLLIRRLRDQTDAVVDKSTVIR